MAGRHPIPLELHKLRGTKQRAKKVNLLDNGVETVGNPPRWLDSDERATWKRIAAAMPEGLLRRVDSGALARYCVALMAFERLHKRIAELPIDDKDGMSLRRLAAEQSKLASRFESEYCVNPSSRGKVSLQIGKDAEGTAFDSFMDQGKRLHERSN